ncbi:hypothetical protein [Polaribacter porphyrae]|uniref:Glycine dehydrogenase n=1 Tax=Polaribacter porphyrae TaxID=1137780 RepID=A0A2S7WQS2_9FLAO|nr:hypothetical protein [Polaribacter porphyrae]PQJ79949.1 hypothetical protein BTO18_12550 [Polaribacter porphyrae]
MFKKLKITCDEATTICDKNQYGEATLLEKIKLNIHFIRCKICFKYTKQNMTLTKIYKGHAKSCKELKHCLSDTDKEVLKEKLNSFKV